MAVVWVFSLILFVLGAPGQADAAWVRDEIRVNMRSGPGTQYRIVKLLRSGDEIQDLGTQGDWTRIRSNDGEEGWVPKGYMVEEPPASVTVPQLRTRLQLAEASVGDLQKKLQNQAEVVGELDTLRSRVRELQVENIRLSGSTRWKELASGGAVVLIGMLIGSMISKGGTKRARRLKL